MYELKLLMIIDSGGEVTGQKDPQCEEKNTGYLNKKIRLSFKSIVSVKQSLYKSGQALRATGG